MAHPYARVAATLAVLCLAGGAVPAAQSRERVAYVSVVDRQSGAPLDELTARDITIREDKVTREVLRVERATGPFPIAILVDNSAAAESAIADLRTALTSFVSALGGAGPVTLITMADRPTVVTPYTSTPATLLTGIQRVFSPPASGATLLDAVQETADGLARREGERAAIVVVSAGGDEQSSRHASTVLTRLKASGATLHAVVLSPPGRGNLLDDPTRQRDTLLARGVTDTGGVRKDVLTSMAFAAALADVARAVTHQFRVVYARPQTLIPPDSFEVTATAPGHRAYGTAARGQPR